MQVKMVPTVYEGPLRKDILEQVHNMDSLICKGQMMEGFVITPEVETVHPRFGRICLKLVSERYLLRKGGTGAK